MTPRRPPGVAYASRPTNRPPTPGWSWPKAIAIVGICLGTLRLIASSGLALLFMLEMAIGGPITDGNPKQQMAEEMPFWWQQFVFTVFGVMLLVASTASLRRKERGRVWMICHSVLYLLAAAVDTGISISSKIEGSSLDFGIYHGAPNARLIPMVGLPVGQFLLAGIYPVAVLIVMRWRNVRAMFYP